VFLCVLSACICEKVKISPVPYYDGPGFKTVVSQSGLSYLEGVGITYLEQKLQTLTVPDQSGDADTPIGHVDWWLTGIVVSDLSIGESSISIDPGVGLSLSITGLSIDFASSWKYRKNSWPHVSDHGTADITVSQTSVSVSLQVTESNGRPVVACTADSVNIGHLDIKLHGGASWLYNFFIGLLHGSIVNSIQSALTNAITQNIDNGANKALSSLPVNVHVNHEVEINYELLNNPVFTAAALTAYQLGEFYSIADPTECPDQYCPPDNLPDSITTEMVQMIIGDYVANSAGYVFWQRGDLKAIISDKDLPAWAPIRLNTTYWSFILPQLTKQYPDNLMVIELLSTNSPKGQFTPSGASITAEGDLIMNIVLANGTMTPAFILQGWVATAGQALLNNQTIYGNLSYLESTFSLNYSSIGNFDATTLQNLVNVLLSQGIVPGVNVLLEHGIQLPTVRGLEFINPTIGWGSGYVYVSTNVEYTPPEDDHEEFY